MSNLAQQSDLQETLDAKVLVYAPTGRDAALLCQFLDHHRIGAHCCTSADDLIKCVEMGSGPVVLSEEALQEAAQTRLLHALEAEPEWSDLPVVLFAARGKRRFRDRMLRARRNATVLNRPIDLATFLSVIQSAVEARRKQYEVRDLLARLHELNRSLENRAHQLRKLTIELTEAEQRERQRVAQVLHDHLQQVLVAAKMRLSSIRNRADNPQAVTAAAADLRGLLQEALDSSRSLTYELSPPMLQQSGLGAAMNWLAGEMREKHRLEVTVQLHSAHFVLADAVRDFLFQAARELLFNVIKHGKIRHATVEMTSDEKCFTLIVRDEGAGFDPDSLRAQNGDHGFGLFNIVERVELLGGVCKIDSEPAKGSRIGIRVPLDLKPKKKTGAAKSVELTPRSNPDFDEEYADKIRVLVVDDHQLVRQGITSMLALESDLIVIGEGNNGEEAIALIAELDPDVVLMDISMPKLDGIGATRRLRAEGADVCIIGLSMFEDEGTANEMRAAGANAYVTKTGPSEALVDTIRSYGRAAQGHL